MEFKYGVNPHAPSQETHDPETMNEPLLEEGRALAALSRTGLCGLGPSRLLRMYRTGRSQRYRPGERLRERRPGFWVVLDGQVEVHTQNGTVFATLGRGSVWGPEEASKGSTVPLELFAGGPDGAWVLFVENHDPREPLPRPQCDSPDEYLHLVSTPPVAMGRVLTLRSRERLNLEVLTELLARTIVNDFEDKVVIVRRGTRPGLVPGESVHPRLFRASIVDGGLPFPPDRFDYILADEDASRLLAHHPALQHTTLQLTRRLPSPAAPEPEADTLLTLLMPVLSAPLEGELEGVVDPKQMPLLQRGCWIHLPDDVLSGARTGLERLDERTRQHLSRWARAVTNRQVGIALSGGGAWGFYHYVVLEALTRGKVPIDVITGSSIGSVMGAYYSVLGMDGLRHFRDRCTRGELNLLTRLSVLSTGPLEALFRRDLGDVQLDELSVRVHPVALNLSTGKATAFTRGPLGLAVRASSSAPGLWGPTLLQPHHFVDGTAVDNLPALWLPHLGADLTFSCNCYPAQLRPYRQRIPGRLGRLLKELNPAGRVLDLVSSGSTLLHASGSLGARMSTRAFHKSPVEDSLLQATNFRRAEEIIRYAREDPVLNETLMEFMKDWEKLRASRGQVRESEPRRALSS
jgi:NTE family protein